MTGPTTAPTTASTSRKGPTMTPLPLLLLLRLQLLTLALRPRARDERGDVPGWVLVTVMTAGLVMVIWGIAEDQLRSMLTSALNQVR